MSPAGGAAFSEAAHVAIALLDQHAPLDLWMVSRVDLANQTVLACDGPWSTVAPVGTVLPWLDSFCLHMAAGTAPPFAARVDEVPAYSAAASGRWADVRGYTGVPLLSAEGDLWGTVSGYTREPDDARLLAATGLQSLVGGLLSAVLTAQASSGEQIENQLMAAGMSAAVAGVPHAGGHQQQPRGTTTVVQSPADLNPPGDALLLQVDPGSHVPHGLVHVSGELDRGTAPSLLALVTDMTTTGYRHIRLDMEHTTFCDVGGLEALEVSQQRLHARGGTLTVLQPCWSLRMLMDTFDLTPTLDTRVAVQVG